MAGMNLNFAVPAINCAFPTMAASSQKRAAASQKVTEPFATGTPPAATDAVSVTVAGEATDVEERASVVTVETAPACAAFGRAVAIATKADRSSLEFRHIQESSDRTYKTRKHLGNGEMPTGGRQIQNISLTYNPNFVSRKSVAT